DQTSVDAAYMRVATYAERWLSGRKRLIRNQVWAQVQRGFDSHPLLEEKVGEMPEWPKGHDWKSCVPKGTEGSNPSLSSSGSGDVARCARFGPPHPRSLRVA